MKNYDYMHQMNRQMDDDSMDVASESAKERVAREASKEERIEDFGESAD